MCKRRGLRGRGLRSGNTGCDSLTVPDIRVHGISRFLKSDVSSPKPDI